MSKKEYVVSEPQNAQELREHLKRHAEQEYELVQVLPNGKGFVVIFSKQTPTAVAVATAGGFKGN